MAVDFPMPGIVDIRMPILGDSFTWAGLEPTAAKKSIVIHGTADDEPNEDGFTMADYHVNHNGWGGIGVHFVITKDQYAGRPGLTPAGVQAQYVGDLGSWRAHVLNQNPTRVGIEISGLFTGRTPSEAQLRKTRELIDFMLAPNNILPSLNFPSQVTYHNAVPDQNTACPGWQYPHFQEWFNYLQGGAEPSWFSTQQPQPTPPTPQPAPAPVVIPVTAVPPVQTPTPAPQSSVSVLDNEPEYKSSYVAQYQALTTTIDGHAIDMTGAGAPIAIPAGSALTIVGHFTDNGKTYYRSDRSTANDATNGTWYGLQADYFSSATGQANGEVPINVTTPESHGLLLSFIKSLAAVLGAILRIRSKKQ